MVAPSLGVLLSGQDILLGHSFQGLLIFCWMETIFPLPLPFPTMPLLFLLCI